MKYNPYLSINANTVVPETMMQLPKIQGKIVRDTALYESIK